MFLSISIISHASIDIYCANCKEILYKYEGTLEHGSAILAKDFYPYGDIPKPVPEDDMLCPKCGAPLNGYEFWFWSRGRPLPKMVYGAITLMTKEDENFIWKPYQVELED